MIMKIKTNLNDYHNGGKCEIVVKYEKNVATPTKPFTSCKNSQIYLMQMGKDLSLT